MERLTKCDEYGNAKIIGVDDMKIEYDVGADDYDKITDVIDKLVEYEDLEEQGKLLKLPCEVGDTVWDNDFGRPCSYEVTGFSFGNLNEGCVEEEMVLDQVLVYVGERCGTAE